MTTEVVPLGHSAAARIGVSTLLLHGARTHKQEYDKLVWTPASRKAGSDTGVQAAGIPQSCLRHPGANGLPASQTSRWPIALLHVRGSGSQCPRPWHGADG